jgi:predicted RNA binding protein YcfA (HicA-like mRNA interferase family)
MNIFNQQSIEKKYTECQLSPVTKQPIEERKVSEISSQIISQDDSQHTSSSTLHLTTVVSGNDGEILKKIDRVAVGKVKEKSSKQVDEKLKNKITEIRGYWNEYVQKNSSRTPISFEEFLASNNTDTFYMTFLTGVHSMALEARHQLFTHLMKAMIGKQKESFQKLYITVFTRLPLIAHLICEYRCLVEPSSHDSKLIRSSDDPSEKKVILAALSEEISIVKKSLYSIQSKLKNYYKNDRKRLLGAMNASSKIIDVLHFIHILKEKQEIEFLFTNSKKIIDSLPTGNFQVPKSYNEYMNFSESMLDQLSDNLQEFVFFWKKDPRVSSTLEPIYKVIELIVSMKSEFKSCRSTRDIDELLELQRHQEEFCGHPIHETVRTLIFKAPKSLTLEVKKLQNRYGLKDQHNLINRLFHHEVIKDYYLRTRYELKFGMKMLLAENGGQLDVEKFESIMLKSKNYAKKNFHVLGFIDKIGIFTGQENHYNFVLNPCKELRDISREVTTKLSFIQKYPEMFQLTADCTFPLIDILSGLSFHILSSGPGLVNNILKIRKDARNIRNNGMDSKKVHAIKAKHKVLNNLKGHFSKEQHVDCEFSNTNDGFTTNMFEKGLFDEYIEGHEHLFETDTFDGVGQTNFEKMFWKYVNENQLWSFDDMQCLLDLVVDMQLGALEIISEVKEICRSPKKMEVLIKESPVPIFPTSVSQSSSSVTRKNLAGSSKIKKSFKTKPIQKNRALVQPLQKKAVESKVEAKQKEDFLKEIDEVPERFWKPQKWYKLRKILKQLRKMGYKKLPDRRGRGSHLMMKRDDGKVITIPKNLKKGTVHSIFKK